MSRGENLNKRYGLLLVSVLFGTTLLSAARIAHADCGNTLPCPIFFDDSCPDAQEECRASFEGGGSCIVAGKFFCYSSGLFAYLVDPILPVTIHLSGDLVELEVFLAHVGPGTSGEMRFFNAAGEEIGVPIVTNGDCLVFMPDPQSRVFEEGVRTIEVTADGGNVYIDTFVATYNLTPAGPPDFDDDCDVGPFDLATLLAAWGPCGGPCKPGDPAGTCPTDLNGDCETGPFDLATLLAAWGPQ